MSGAVRFSRLTPCKRASFSKSLCVLEGLPSANARASKNGPSTSKFLRTSFPDLLAGPGGAGLDVGPRSHIDIWLVFARNPTFRKNFEVEETCSKKVENSRSEKTPWGLAGWPLAKGAGFSESLCVFWKVGLLREKTVHRLERATTSDVHPHY